MANVTNNVTKVENDVHYKFCVKLLKRLSTTENDKIIATVTGAVSISLSIPTVLFNGGIVYAIAKRKQLHSTYNFFVMNMCTACLIIGVVNQVMSGILYVTQDQNYCWVFRMSSFTLILSPFLTLCVVLLERYLKIFHPLHCEKLLDIKISAVKILLTWMIPILISVISCQTKKMSHQETIRATLKLQAAIYIVGIMWISFVNIKTALLVRNIHKETRRQQTRFTARPQRMKDINTAVVFTTFCIVSFVISYLPFCVLVFLNIPCNKISWAAISIIIILLNFSADIAPAFVMWFHKNIRVQLLSFFMRESRKHQVETE